MNSAGGAISGLKSKKVILYDKYYYYDVLKLIPIHRY